MDPSGDNKESRIPGSLARIALRTCLLYAFLSALWIALSDRLLVAIWSDPDTIAQVSTYKGWAFVVVTGVWLYATLRTQLLRWAQETEKRRRAEEELRRYELMANHTRDIILFIRSPDGQILEANTAALEAYGYRREELMGLAIHQIRATATEPLIPAQMTEAGARGILFETVHRRKDGSTFPVEVSSQGVIVGGTQTLVSVVRDITVRKQAEEALKQAHDALEKRVEERTAELRRAYDSLREGTKDRQRLEAQLRQAQKMEALGTLSGGIAHDFNNILAAIIGFTEIVAGDVTEARDQRHLARVMEAALRGRDLVRQMLTFSRKAEQEKKPVLLGAIVTETMALLRASIPTTVAIRLDIRNGSGVVFGDPTQIQQVLMNLCTNAAQAMGEKGGELTVEIGSSIISSSEADQQNVVPGPYLTLIVRDTGTGIAPEIMDKIFDPFFTTKKVGSGTGLGLSVVHGIVRQSGGFITVESEPGKGSSFTVFLPEIEGAVDTDNVKDAAIPLGHERVLFVDDEAVLSEMGENIIAELGYEVTTRTNSTEALSLVKADPGRFDLIVTDQTMPELTGIDLAKEILAVRPDMPIIMCTGFSHLVDADRAKAAGIRAFVMKPLTKREIARTIRQVLDE